ncbi:MAG: thiamine pyrophosphate-dependent enzyme [Planctomycetota bacterium]
MSTRLAPKKVNSRKSRRPVTGSLFVRTLDISQTDAVEMLRRMLMIRRLDDKVRELMAENRLPGETWSCAGREALIVGACALLRDTDYIVCAHGEYTQLLARNGELNSILAKLSDKIFADTALAGKNAISGDSAVAVGVALACNLNKRQQSVIYFCDDDELAQTSFREALCLATRSTLPLVIICEGAHAGSVSVKSGRTILALAKDCGVEVASCDGMNVLEVRETVAVACDLSRSGKGPTLIEVSITPRPTSDVNTTTPVPQASRLPLAHETLHLSKHAGETSAARKNSRCSTKKSEWKVNDSVLQYRLRLAEVGALSSAQAEKLDQVVIKEIAAASRLALAESAAPDHAEMLRHVYKGWIEGPYGLVRHTC